jgi:DNA-binding Lrp family transcriptional regulator
MPDAYACFEAEAGELPALVRAVREIPAVESVHVVTGEYDAVAHLDLDDPPVETIDVLHRELSIEPRDDLPERTVDAIEGVEGVSNVELTYAFEP